MDLTPVFVAEEFKRIGAVPTKETTWKEIEGVVYACPVGVLTEYLTDELRPFGSVDNWITRECEVERRYALPHTFWVGVADEWDGLLRVERDRTAYQTGRHFAAAVIALVGKPLPLPNA